MTREEFVDFYPQFDGFTPGIVMDAYIGQANARFSDFGEDAEEARRLYVAHKLTLYAWTALPEGQEASMAVIASSGGNQRIASKKVGEVAVSYAASSSSGTSVFADLTETAYGLQLLTLIRMYSFGKYVP